MTDLVDDEVRVGDFVASNIRSLDRRGVRLELLIKAVEKTRAVAFLELCVRGFRVVREECVDEAGTPCVLSC